MEARPGAPIVVWDVETTELIDKRRCSISNMEISVACCIIIDYELLCDDSEQAIASATRCSFWHEDADRGLPLEALSQILAKSRVHIAFNGNHFDMPVMRRFFESAEMYKRACQRLYDPFEDLSNSVGSFSLASLLSTNRLDSKTGHGSDAPVLWKHRELDALESYCASDVELLTRLVTRPTIKLPGMGFRTPMGTLSSLFEHMLERPSKRQKGEVAKVDVYEPSIGTRTGPDSVSE